MPSQIDCRHGSRESLHVPVLSRDISSPSLLQFQLSRRAILLRQNSSSVTAVFLTMQTESRFPLRNSTACTLEHSMLSCPIAVCVHVHVLWECVDLDQTLCIGTPIKYRSIRFTFISSLSLGQVVFLVVSFTLLMMSARLDGNADSPRDLQHVDATFFGGLR